ncbi:MAG: PSD1 and planctomycete cytochrome C domain-containing protein [Planctomycetia bacterium]|nr:PSD1 and planctomycete cytochrome C domain-containing protein [Planctomycetia bacterium]
MKHRLLFVVVLLLAARASAAADRISFNREIRPILSDACFQCHGPDDKQRKAGLRLDVKESALKAAESGATAVVPGKVDASELIKRLITTDESLRMPPANSGKKITPQQIELIKRWIAEGAEYQGHWAFIPAVRPAVPDLKPEISNLKSQIPNSIDHFILARLNQAGLKSSAEADKTTLIRRVTLDLTGLPPTPGAVDTFLADTSDNAYEKVVDRLLKSPRYGEQMARPWLDMARYADSNGFQVDSSRFQWPWRDWVIHTFNDNMPFDQFTVEQLAGDLLPKPTQSQIVATGFNRNHRLNGEGGIIAEEWRVETVIDRVETTGMTWLGLTFNCCRCHDHKYDPISQRDFYSMFAFFNNVTESGTLQGESKNTDPTISVPTAEQESELKRLDKEIVAANVRAAEEAKRLPELIAAWEPGFRKKLLAEENVSVWSPLQPSDVKSAGGAKLTKQADGTYLASGTNPPHDVYTIAAPIGAGQFSGLLLDTLPDDSLSMKSLGRFSNGNFVLSRIEAEITSPDLPSPLIAKFARAEATYSQKGWEIGLVLDDSPSNGWAVDGPTRHDPTSAMFLLESPLTIPTNATLTVRLKHEALNQHNIGRFRVSMTSLPPSTVKLDGAKFPESLKTILELAADKRSDAQKAELTNFFKANVDSPLKQAEVAAASTKKSRDDLAATTPNVMVMKEGPSRDAFILIRGEYDKRGEKVGTALPAALMASSRTRESSDRSLTTSATPAASAVPLTRLDLAKWIVSRDNPLTARVWVNRQWERFFGNGLVKTTENLGSQAEYPSHPELLDWLAVEFMADWDMKHLQKLIVMSTTYRQSSREQVNQNPGLSTLDSRLNEPDNRLLARGPRVRLSAEALRDQALFASGLLVEKLGGQSVRPYMPDGVWDETSKYGDLRGYKHDTNDGLYRRTLYTIWKRTAAPPSMLLFDAPSREICTVKRSRTNTPLQALTLLNEITYVEAARKLAERMLVDGGATPEARLRFAFRRVTSRTPTDEEVALLVGGLNDDLTRFRQDAIAAKKLIVLGESKADASLEPAELAAYTLTANVLLNLDEVVTRE